MALTKGKKRLSIDFDNATYSALENYTDPEKFPKWTDPTNLTKGYIINDAVKNLVSLNGKTANELYAFCAKQAQIHEKNARPVNTSQFSESAEINSQFSKDEELEIANQFRNLAHMYSHYAAFPSSIEPKIKDMKRIDIQNGYVVFPKDWILIDWNNPATSQNAFVIEVVDEKNQYQMPHFLFFDESMKTVEAQKNKIFEKAAEAYPRFRKILKLEVEPVYGEEDDKGFRKILNPDEYLNAPKSLIFKIADAGNELIMNYPYNAKVYRKSNK